MRIHATRIHLSSTCIYVYTCMHSVNVSVQVVKSCMCTIGPYCELVLQQSDGTECYRAQEQVSTYMHIHVTSCMVDLFPLLQILLMTSLGGHFGMDSSMSVFGSYSHEDLTLVGEKFLHSFEVYQLHNNL